MRGFNKFCEFFKCPNVVVVVEAQAWLKLESISRHNRCIGRKSDVL